MAIHGAIILDHTLATYHGNLVSLTHTADLDNGSVVQVGDLASNQRELFQVAVPDATSINNDPLVLVTTPELTYLAGQTILDFYNPANGEIRGHILVTGDIVTITNNMLTGTPAVDSYVEPTAGATMLTVTATLPTTRFIGKIIETTTIFGQAATVIRVIKN